MQDLARIVRGAVEYEGVWPETGGLRGGRLSVGELVKLGEELRGLWSPCNLGFPSSSMFLILLSVLEI